MSLAYPCERKDLLGIEGLDDREETVDSDDSERHLWVLERPLLEPRSYFLNCMSCRRSSKAAVIPTVQRVKKESFHVRVEFSKVDVLRKGK
jgi:hypothetical protein